MWQKRFCMVAMLHSRKNRFFFIWEKSFQCEISSLFMQQGCRSKPLWSKISSVTFQIEANFITVYEIMRVWKAFHSGKCMYQDSFHENFMIQCREIVAVNEEILKDKHMTECFCWELQARDSCAILHVNIESCAVHYMYFLFCCWFNMFCDNQASSCSRTHWEMYCLLYYDNCLAIPHIYTD